MATPAGFPRMSFGASQALDLSLNLPIVLLPPSAGPRTDSETDEDDDDLPSVRSAPVHSDTRPARHAVATDTDPDPDSPTEGAYPRDPSAYDRYRYDHADYDAQKTPTALGAPTPLVPERDTRRNNTHERDHSHDHKPPTQPPASATAPTPAPAAPAPSNVPLHPIPSMQGAFAESLLEVTDGKPADKPKLRYGDAKERREDLISQERDEQLYSARWRYRPGQEQHELHKLMAQISFGVYLLLNGMANSAAQVVNILQGHIDEVDEFLEVTMEDFQEASTDLKERIDYLRLPMENMEVFEKLLEDRNFRLQIVEGNEKIEHIVARTNVLLEQYDKDIQQGLASAREFAIYLTQQKDGDWALDRHDVVDIYEAMKGNTEGWFNAFVDLQAQGKELNTLVVKLGQVVSEMSSKAGEVSRRTWASIPPFSVPLPESSSGDASLRSPPSSLPSPRSGRRSTMTRGSSFNGSAPGSSHSSAKPAYFDMPARKSDTAPSMARSSASSHKRQTSQTFQPVPESPTDPFSDQTSRAAADSDSDTATATGVDEAPLFLLQPRTYTPQPPEPIPSPMVHEPAHPPQKPVQQPVQHPSQQPVQRPAQKPIPAPVSKRTSLRQRVSLKTQPPDSIRIPPPHQAEYRPASHGSLGSHAPGTPDSAYSEDTQRPRYGTIAEMPVQASPHSPLQQRPQTAGASPPQYSVHGGSFRPGHQRNAPSRMGGASMLSNVTTMTYDSKATGATDKKLKKKRSAFGWLKKAFSLDEEERLAYESRRQQADANLYYDGRSPKYLDGRRVG
ncbi:hypothetical protein B0T11DRAFT_323673 [Plectosphaerella cucumerina]|uniref:Uncharacterized protein n=1 Tax=Plectosphaerella cucumerina TaxID=40658 RepID=A0A8K0X8B6_9PEZI|nr:hypothetical protein B0T11DRAFT_323673 [Plectosphaerella cucumerina]